MTMALVDMKRSKPKKETGKEMPVTTGYDRYPWGLQFHLDTEELDKLGINIKNLEIDQQVTVNAQACVTSISMSESAGDRKERKSVSLQIEKLELVGLKKSKYSGFNSQQKKGAGE
jgi:hypothetical protein